RVIDSVNTSDRLTRATQRLRVPTDQAKMKHPQNVIRRIVVHQHRLDSARRKGLTQVGSTGIQHHLVALGTDQRTARAADIPGVVPRPLTGATPATIDRYPAGIRGAQKFQFKIHWLPGPTTRYQPKHPPANSVSQPADGKPVPVHRCYPPWPCRAGCWRQSALHGPLGSPPPPVFPDPG